MRTRLACLLLLVTATPAPAQAPRTDSFGDPLPKGAVARLGTTRFHHRHFLSAVAFAPDGKTILVADVQRTKRTSVRYWDAVTGEERGRFTAPHFFNQAAFTPDGKQVLLGDWDTIEVRERATGKLVRTFGGDDHLAAWRLSPDGTLLAALQADRKKERVPVRVWDLATGKELPPFEGPGVAEDGALRFSIDGKRLMARKVVRRDDDRGSRCRVCVWDVASRKLVHDVGTLDADVALAPDGETCAFAVDGGIFAYHLPTATKKLVGAAPAPVRGFSPDGKTFFSAGPEQPAELWDVAAGKLLRRFRLNVTKEHYFAGFAPDGQAIALTWSAWHGEDHGLAVLDVATGRPRRPGDGHDGGVACVAFGPGDLVASGGDDGAVVLWDLRTRKVLTRLDGHAAPVSAVAFAPGGRLLASSSRDGRTVLWDVAAGRLLARLDGPKDGATALGFAADGAVLTAATHEGEVIVWSVPAGKVVWASPQDPTRWVLAFAPADGLALTVRGEGEGFGYTEGLRLWHPLLGAAARELPLRSRPNSNGRNLVFTAAWSGDGRLVAWPQTWAIRGERRWFYSHSAVHVRDRSTGQPVRTFAEVLAFQVALSRDGRLHVTVPRYTQAEPDTPPGLAVWDVLTGERRAVYAGHVGPVTCVAVSPDGKYVVTGGSGHTLLVWEVPAPTAARAVPLPTHQMERWWDDLAADAAVAYPAVAGLIDYPEEAVAWLKTRLHPAPPVDTGRIAALLQGLDSGSFKERQQAMLALEGLGELAEPALRTALEANPSLELRRRLELLLAKIETTPPTPEQLRQWRAVAALEWIGDDGARAVLEKLAGGAPESRLTREAAAALERLQRRGGW
jgi:WD40 repeat protein